MQFARVAQATDFIYCYSILEVNKRSEYSTNASTSTPQSPLTLPLNEPAHAELSTFFPFDPYKLPKSKGYVTGIYREWTSVAYGEDEEEEEEDEDEDGEEDAGGDEENETVEEEDRERETLDRESNRLDIRSGRVGMRHELDDDGLGVSFESMSITPARARSWVSAVS